MDESHPGLLLVRDGWRTPDTYSAHYDDLEPVPAVYLLLAFYPMGKLKPPLIAYVGMATNVRNRLQSHEVAEKIRKAGFDYIQRWFKLTATERLRDVERHYIKTFDPPWNLIGRKKGVSA